MQTMHFATSRATAASPAQEFEPGSKRERTRVRMEKAAVALAMELGPENVTVDQICAAAEVSPRTFFNYFGGKEAAIIGRGKPSPTPEDVEAFVASDGPILHDFLKLIIETATKSEPDLDLIRARRQLMHENSDIATLAFSRNIRSREEFTQIASARLRRERPEATEDDIQDEAMVAVGVLMGVTHVIGNRWVESDGQADVDGLIDSALARLKKLI